MATPGAAKSGELPTMNPLYVATDGASAATMMVQPAHAAAGVLPATSADHSFPLAPRPQPGSMASGVPSAITGLPAPHSSAGVDVGGAGKGTAVAATGTGSPPACPVSGASATADGPLGGKYDLSGHTLVYGGSFNPLHVEHEALMLYALRSTGADALWMVPAYNHRFKPGLLAYEDRCGMCSVFRLALPGDDGDKISVCRVEEAMAGQGNTNGRTLEMLQALQQQHPGRRFALVVGEDILNEAHNWYQWDDIVDLVPVVVVKREGVEKNPELAAYYDNPKLLYLPAPMRPVSSTDVRSRLHQGASVDGLVSPAVAAYIQQHQLYLPASAVVAAEAWVALRARATQPECADAAQKDRLKAEGLALLQTNPRLQAAQHYAALIAALHGKPNHADEVKTAIQRWFPAVVQKSAERGRVIEPTLCEDLMLAAELIVVGEHGVPAEVMCSGRRLTDAERKQWIDPINGEAAKLLATLPDARAQRIAALVRGVDGDSLAVGLLHALRDATAMDAPRAWRKAQFPPDGRMPPDAIVAALRDNNIRPGRNSVATGLVTALFADPRP